MNPEQSLPKRSHPAHGIFDFTDNPTIIFLTICTEKRVPWLATEFNHALFRSVCLQATAWRVGRYVLMPDHLHCFASPGDVDLSLENWVQYVKSQFRKKHPDKSIHWQTDHWDTRLRKGDSYDEKWQYVLPNPVRAGLVECAAEWPYQGELFLLRWE